MAISDKLTYLNDTKTQLKDMINYGLDTGEKITSETTFRNYVKSLFDAFIKTMTYPDVLYNNLPKVTGEGTSLTLNDTVYAPMRVELSPSELEQGANPSPDYPQEIHTVSGENTINVTGKNLFDKSKATLNTLINRTTGALAESTTYATTDYMPVVAGQQYTFTNFNYWYVCSYDKDKNVLGNVDNLATITIPNNVCYLRGSFLMSNIDSVQFEKGNTATSYQSFQGSQSFNVNLGDIEYCKIGDYEDEFIRNSGKNLFDITATPYRVGGSTTYSVNGNVLNVQGNWYVAYQIDVVANTDYYLSATRKKTTSVSSTGNISIYNANVTLPVYNGGAGNFTFNTGDNTQITIVFYSGNGSSGNVDFYDIILSKGTTALPYEPYGSGEWYLKKNVGKVVLDNTLSNVGTTAFNNVYAIYSNTIGITYLVGGFCDNFKFNTDSRITDNTTANDYLSDNQMALRLGNDSARDRLYIKSTNFASADELKQYFNNNPTSVYYVLATPTYTLLSDTLQTQLDNIQKAISYQDQTNVSQTNNDLPFVIKLSAIRDYEEI